MNGLSYLTVLTYVDFRCRGGTKASGGGGALLFLGFQTQSALLKDDSWSVNFCKSKPE